MLVSVNKPIGRFVQQPWEVRRYRVEYTKNLAENELLSTSEFVVSPTSEPTPLSITNAVIDPTGKNLIFFVGGGEDGIRYKLSVRVITSAGQKIEDEIELLVEER